MTNTNQLLTVGLIGCGRMGARTDERVRKNVPIGWLPLSHAEAIRSVSDIELVALCDSNQESMEWTGQKYNVKAQFTDYKELIAQIKPDILAIATRTAGRCDIIEFAAENGVRGIHAEKPLSTNMADCNRALSAVEKNDVKLTYGTLRRFMGAYRQAKDIIESGAIGDLVEIIIEHGRTLLMWSHPHSMDLLIFFTSCLDVRYVQSSCLYVESSLRGSIVDEDPITENAFLKFGNGVTGVITSAPGMNVRLCGTVGTLNVMADGSWLEVSKKKKGDCPYYTRVQRIQIAPAMSGTERAFFELGKAIREGNQISIKTSEIALSQKMLFGCMFSSIEGGRRVQLSDISEHFTVTGRWNEFYA